MHRLLALLLLCVAANLTSAAQDAEKALKQFEGKILVLRHPLEGDSLQYGAEGNVLKGGEPGPWTIYGGVLVDRISLLPDKLKIEGRRILFLFQERHLVTRELKRRGLRGTPFPSSVQLEISLGRALDSEEQARTTLSRVFALNTADLVEGMPDYWRKCTADLLGYDPSQSQEAEFSWQTYTQIGKAPPGKAQPGPANDNKSVEPGPLVFFVGGGVTAPRPLFTPEPKYTSIARYEELEGVTVLNVIVGVDGKIHSARLIYPLGLGLDESALSMIQTWRFSPSTREGKPVAVEMNIEIAFHLF